MLHSSAHIIATVRAKTDYTLSEENREQVPEKAGLRSIQREGLDYEFTLVFELDLRHQRPQPPKTGLGSIVTKDLSISALKLDWHFYNGVRPAPRPRTRSTSVQPLSVPDPARVDRALL
ncbi:hypothetical protein ACW9KT_09010 [Hymenobacter sp. HD11105]